MTSTVKSIVRAAALSLCAITSLVCPTNAQPVLNAEETTGFLETTLANDLGLTGASVIVEDRTVHVSLPFADTAQDEVVGKLALVLLTAGAAAHWSETVQVTGYALAAPVFSVRVPTGRIAAYVAGEISSEVYLSSWVFAGEVADMATPVAELPLVLAPAADTHVYAYDWQNWDRANWGAYHVLGAGWHPVGGEKRSFLRFDLSGIDLASVSRAELHLYHYHTAGDTTRPLGIYRVTEGWREGRGTYQPSSPALAGETTWRNQPAIDPRTLARLDLPSPPERTVSVEVTALVQAWASGFPNHGLMIGAQGRPGPDMPESMYGFYAREHPEADKRPSLVLYMRDGAAVQVQPDAPEAPTHWLVIDGTISGTAATEYEIQFDGEIRQVDGPLEGFDVTMTGDDQVLADRIIGRVGEDTDGYRVTGTLRTLTLSAPEAARVYMDGNLIWAPEPASRAPEAYHEPERGTDERAAILDAVRGPVSAAIGIMVGFDVTRLQSDGTWAFVEAIPVIPGGAPVDWSKTPFATAWQDGMMTETVWALLYRNGDEWRVVDHIVGPTDVYWYTWVEQFGLPVAVFNPL